MKHTNQFPLFRNKSFFGAFHIGDATHTRYVRLATRWGRDEPYSTFVHPAIAMGLMKNDTLIPPGDVVARWNQAILKQNVEEAARLFGILRDGLPICVYCTPKT